MREPAARIGRAEHFKSIAAGLDEADFAFLIDHEGHAVRDPVLRHEDPIFLRNTAIDKVAQQRKREAKTFRERFLRWPVIGTDGENLGARFFILLHPSLECFHFGRSATGKCSGKEGEYDRALADEVGQVNGLTFGRRQCKVRSLVTNFVR